MHTNIKQARHLGAVLQWINAASTLTFKTFIEINRTTDHIELLILIFS